VGFLFMLIGVAIISICRPYIVQILFFSTFLLSIYTVLLSIRNNRYRVLGLSLFVLPVLFLPFMQGASSDQTISSIDYNTKYIDSYPDKIIKKYKVWEKSTILPEFVDKKLFALSFSRYPYEDLKSSDNATTRSFDLTDEAEFHSARDMILYLPRALQLALFAPFPNDWSIFYKSIDRSTFRLMLSIEMFYVYIAVIFLVLGLYKSKSPKYYALSYYMIVVLLVYGVAIPNIGVMYRYKYSYLMILVGIGTAFLIKNFMCLIKNKSFLVLSGKMPT